MSEVTLETGTLPICVDCQIKHAVDLKAHTEPGTERREKVAEIVEDIRRDLSMRKDQLREFEEIREIEHKIEDYLTVLRDMRHDLQAQTVPEELQENPGKKEYRIFIEYKSGVTSEMYPPVHSREDAETIKRLREKEPDVKQVAIVESENPGLEGCAFQKEVKKPKEEFDPASFRTLCPECPEDRCALCPPDLRCATRVMIGCPTGEFKQGRCQVGTMAHVIFHGEPKPEAPSLSLMKQQVRPQTLIEQPKQPGG